VSGFLDVNSSCSFSSLTRFKIFDKDSGLKQVLLNYKNGHLKYDIILYYVLRHEHPEWPEWAAIDKSLRASGMI